jgi:TPR repeat protein
MQLHQILILFLMMGFGTLNAMDKPPRKSRGRDTYHQTITAPKQELEGQEREQHAEETKKAYQEKQIAFSLPHKELQQAQSLILGPQPNYEQAKKLINSLIYSTNAQTKAGAFFLRGTIRFNGLGQEVDLRGAFNDFQKILDFPEDLEIKTPAQNFKLVTQALLEITKAVDHSPMFENALLEVKIILDELPYPLLNAQLLDKVLKIIAHKYPHLNLVLTAIKLDIPGNVTFLQKLIEKDATYYEQGTYIIKQAFLNKNRELFLKFFTIPAIADDIIIKQDVLIQATKKHDYDRLSLLADAGVNLNYVNEHTQNPLIIAITEGNPELVQWLLRHGANPLYQIPLNDYLITPLSVANTQDYPHKEEILQLLSSLSAPLAPSAQTPHTSVEKNPTESESQQLSRAELVKKSAAKAYQASRTPIISMKKSKRKIQDVDPKAPLQLPLSRAQEVKQSTTEAYQASQTPIISLKHAETEEYSQQPAIQASQEVNLPLDYDPYEKYEPSTIKDDYTAEYNWLKQVALENPNPERKAYAEYRLGNIFFFGITPSFEYDLDRALQHYQRAAELSTSYIRKKALEKINEIVIKQTQAYYE